MTRPVRSKLTLRGERVTISAGSATGIVSDIFQRIGCDENTALTVASHLADTSLCGMGPPIDSIINMPLPYRWGVCLA